MVDYDTTHQCPGPGCKRRVPEHMLMCSIHWYQVPAQLQSAALVAWRNWRLTGAMEHIEAVRATVKAIQ